jgi:hypothetical protein
MDPCVVYAHSVHGLYPPETFVWSFWENGYQYLIPEVDCVDSHILRQPIRVYKTFDPQKVINMRLSALIVRREQVGSSSSNDNQTELGAVSMNIDDSSPVIISRK